MYSKLVFGLVAVAGLAAATDNTQAGADAAPDAIHLPLGVGPVVLPSRLRDGFPKPSHIAKVQDPAYSAAASFDAQVTPAPEGGNVPANPGGPMSYGGNVPANPGGPMSYGGGSHEHHHSGAAHPSGHGHKKHKCDKKKHHAHGTGRPHHAHGTGRPHHPMTTGSPKFHGRPIMDDKTGDIRSKPEEGEEDDDECEAEHHHHHGTGAHGTGVHHHRPTAMPDAPGAGGAGYPSASLSDASSMVYSSFLTQVTPAAAASASDADTGASPSSDLGASPSDASY